VQAEHGQAIYARRCAGCHRGSQFIGQDFVESWNDRRLYDFYALVSSTMPLNAPGTLKEHEYLAVLAYLLKANNAAHRLQLEHATLDVPSNSRTGRTPERERPSGLRLEVVVHEPRAECGRRRQCRPHARERMR
jgi:hypothetical protein